MSTTDAHKASPTTIALQPGEGDAHWFLGALLTIKSSRETTDGRVAVIEHHASQGHGSPLHVHHNEDEWFYVTEGELTGGGRRTSRPEPRSPNRRPRTGRSWRPLATRESIMSSQPPVVSLPSQAIASYRTTLETCTRGRQRSGRTRTSSTNIPLSRKERTG